MKIIRNIKYIFRPRKLAFEPIDPLGDGLREMIQREQSTTESFSLYDDDYSNNTHFWQALEQDLHN